MFKFFFFKSKKLKNMINNFISVVSPIEDKNGHLTVEKVTTSSPSNGKSYSLGETITYKISVTNDGNLTIINIKVTDELTGDEWTIESLAPGETKDFETTYVVTEQDIVNGEVLNVATATGLSPDNDSPDVPVDPGTDPEPVDDPCEHINIEKIVTNNPANGETFALGESINYKILIVNDGNLTALNVKVTDELTGDEWYIESLAPGERVQFTCSYVVTEADILAGQVSNTARVRGETAIINSNV